MSRNKTAQAYNLDGDILGYLAIRNGRALRDKKRKVLVFENEAEANRVLKQIDRLETLGAIGAGLIVAAIFGSRMAPLVALAMAIIGAIPVALMFSTKYDYR